MSVPTVEAHSAHSETPFSSSFAAYMNDGHLFHQCLDDARQSWVHHVEVLDEGIQYRVTFTDERGMSRDARVERDSLKIGARNGEKTIIQLPVGTLHLSALSEKRKEEILKGISKFPAGLAMDEWLTRPEPLKDYGRMHPVARFDAERQELQISIETYAWPMHRQNVWLVGWQLIFMRKSLPDMLTHIQKTFGDAFVPHHA